VRVAVDPEIRRPQRAAPVVGPRRHQRRQVAAVGGGQDVGFDQWIVARHLEMSRMRRVMADHHQWSRSDLAHLGLKVCARLHVARERVLRQKTILVLVKPDLAEIIHSFTSDAHGEPLVTEQIEVGPKGRTREGDVADPDALVLEHVDGSPRGGLLRLLDGPIDVAAVALMIAGDVDDGTVRHAVAQPLHPALHARNKVAGNDKNMETRACGSGRQVPAAGQFEMQIGKDPEQHFVSHGSSRRLARPGAPSPE
jgi:hypothetical protein